MSGFEALMLICFGMSWPVSIAKTLRTKEVAGKSLLFMAVVCLGYLSGIVHKALYACDWIVLLYILNLSMVVIDLFLYYRYLPMRRELWTTLVGRLRRRSAESPIAGTDYDHA